MPTLLKSKRLGWGVIFGLTMLIALLSYFSGSRYLAAVRAVEHELSVERAVDGTLSLLKDAETGQRGYILSGDPQFLEPYEAALRQVPPLFSQLTALTSGDGQQGERLRTLRRLIDEKCAFIEATVRLRRDGDLERATALVRGGRGQQLMDEIREQCGKMSEREEHVLAARRSETHRAKLTAVLGIGGSTSLMILLALLSLLTVNRDVRALKQAAAEVAKSEEHYRWLTEQSHDLVQLLGLDGATTYVSPSVERLLGYGVDEYRKLSPMALMHPDELDIARGILTEVKSGAVEGGMATYRLRHKSGDYRWFEVKWGVIRDAEREPREARRTAAGTAKEPRAPCRSESCSPCS